MRSFPWRLRKTKWPSSEAALTTDLVALFKALGGGWSEFPERDAALLEYGTPPLKAPLVESNYRPGVRRYQLNVRLCKNKRLVLGAVIRAGRIRLGTRAWRPSHGGLAILVVGAGVFFLRRVRGRGILWPIRGYSLGCGSQPGWSG